MSWSLRAKCAMYGCMNATYNKLGSGMLFHRFPKNPERQYLWKLRCQNPRIMEKYHKCLFVCGAHFDKSCYHGHNQHLKPDAIPCINLPAVGNGLMSYEQAKNEMETNSSATAADEESSLSKYSHQRKNLDISSSEDGDSDDEVQLDQEEYESIKLEPGLSDARRNSLHSPIPSSSPPIPVEPVYQNLPVISHVHTVADTPALRPISRSGASMVFNYQRNSQHSPGPTVSPPVPTEPAYQTLPDISNVQQPTQHLRASSAAINVGDIDETEDDCSTFAAHVKMKMRKFDTIQKHIAQKLISDIMFMADTRQLQLTTAIINTQAPRIGPHLVVGDSRQLQITSNMINNRPQVPQAVQTSQIRQGSAPPQFKPAFPTIVATQPAQTYQVTQVAEVKEAPKPQTVSNGTSKMMTGSFSAYLVDSESDDDDTPLTKRRK